jgi:hypothetical protein
LVWRGAFALALFSTGCGARPPVSAAPTCQPDGAALTDAPLDMAPPVVVETPDASADRPDDAAPQHDLAPVPDATAAVDRVTYPDGPLPDGVVGSPPITNERVLIATVTVGLLDDIEMALGRELLGSVGFAQAIDVYAGFGVDYVYMKVGGIDSPRGDTMTPGVVPALVLSFGGPRTYDGMPAQLPHPEFAPARTLFDAMVNVPETTTSEGRVRESPGKRVRCRVPNLDAAYCTFTGFQRAALNH